jgi:DeoR family transcriptional regulator, suf operon transcriptional repressor
LRSKACILIFDINHCQKSPKGYNSGVAKLDSHMAVEAKTSDAGLIELLRRNGAMSVAQLIAAMNVTATAVRQRLRRLTKDGSVERITVKTARGRPSHRYSLTAKARQQAGSNFADLTIALWQEVRAIRNEETRGTVLKRLAGKMAGLYGGAMRGSNTGERMQDVVALMAERNVPFAIDRSGQLPVLRADACPYPELAEQDRGICAVEKMMFSEMLGEKVHLSECRLDGASCCRFQTN